MKTAKRLWVPVLLGVLLMTTLVGVASARPNARPQQQAWRVLTVGTPACVPCSDDQDYGRGEDDWLRCEGAAGCCFLCSVYFPAAGEQAVGAVNVKRVTMYAYDNTVGKAVDFMMGKRYPPTKGGATMASGTTIDSSADPQTVVDASIENNPIYRVQEPGIVLFMGTDLIVYGFFIHYTW
jgi:hypothetical protein